jgi:hypothetical protein
MYLIISAITSEGRGTPDVHGCYSSMKVAIENMEREALYYIDNKDDWDLEVNIIDPVNESAEIVLVHKHSEDVVCLQIWKKPFNMNMEE